MEPVGDYEYSKRDLIGHGAFAVVFRGRLRKKPEFTVAIKCITKKNLAKSQNLLSKEIKILKELSELRHENVVQLLDCKETSHHVYLVMEFCNGGDLADYLQVKGTLSEDTIAVFLRQIAEAMRCLVAKGIVHRDMKPQNILLCHNGKVPNPSPLEMRLKIADFGFARFLQDGVMAATLCGSPMYMAPEVIMSWQYDAKADLWSIGTICYQCLTGKAPFQAQTPQQLKQFYEKNAGLAPNIPSGTSPELKDLLMGMLKRNAKDRIDFEDFFVHSFLRTKAQPKSSSPVPVPRSRSRCSIGESPPVKPVSASPLSGRVPVSPPNPVVATEEPMETESSREDIPPPLPPRTRSRSRSPTEDFVMVPDNIPSDHSAGSGDSAKPPCAVDLNAIFSDTSPDSPRPAPRTTRPISRTPTDGTPGSPGRPSSLPVTTAASSAQSQPIPVPSQVKAYEQMQRSSPGSPKGPSPVSPQCTVTPALGQPIPIPRKASAGSIPSLGSLSPPSVKFTIGTPPSRPSRRPSGGTPPLSRHSVTPPTTAGSPLRRTGVTPPRNLTPIFTGPSSLPTIMGSPTKTAGGIIFPDVVPINTSPSKSPLATPFGTVRTRTVPDNMTTMGFNLNDNSSVVPVQKFDHGVTEPERLFHRSHSTGGRLSEQLLRAAFGGTPPSNLGLSPRITPTPSSRGLIPYSSSNPTLPINVDSPRIGQGENTNSELGSRRPSVFLAESPTNANVAFTASPPNMEGPISFVAPELQEEVLMDKEHIETVGKLSFILALVECIIELAQTRSSPITESVDHKTADSFRLDHVPFASESQRHMEQLVLYVRGLQLLSSSIQLARTETKAGRLQPSNTVKTILKEMNNYYQQCLGLCRHLHSKGVTRNNPQVSPATAAVTADKLIYSYAIEMCQTAALDELFGNPQECFRRYRNAQILLHSLAQQAQDLKDRELLNRYKESVEKRLFNLHSQGYVQAIDS